MKREKISVCTVIFAVHEMKNRTTVDDENRVEGDLIVLTLEEKTREKIEEEEKSSGKGERCGGHMVSVLQLFYSYKLSFTYSTVGLLLIKSYTSATCFIFDTVLLLIKYCFSMLEAGQIRKLCIIEDNLGDADYEK